MPNLVKNLHSSLKSVFKDKMLVAFIALVAAVAINQLVFSYLLVDRNKAKALETNMLNFLVKNLGSLTFYPGDTGVLLSQFVFPDSLTNDSASGPVCSERVDNPTHTYNNPCFQMVDADGDVTANNGAPAALDGPEFIFQFNPRNDMKGTYLTNVGIPGQVNSNICTDNALNPTCVYIDSDGSCDTTGVGTITYLLNPTDPVGCESGSDLIVFNINPTPTSTLVTYWLHTDLDDNGLYDLGEDIYVVESNADRVLETGSVWGQAFSGQWFGDDAGVSISMGTADAPAYLDADGNHVYSGNTSGGTDAIILDSDGNGAYTAEASILLDADGATTVGVGINDDVMVPGDGLRPLKPIDNICFNTKPGTGDFVAYYDDSDDFDGLSDGVGGNCIPGDGGSGDVLLVSEDPAVPDMATVVTNYNANPTIYPNSFISATFIGAYKDANTNNLWDPGIESLWLKQGAPGQWHPNIEGAWPFDTDGTANLNIQGTSDPLQFPDDDSWRDGLTRGSFLTDIATSDNLCIGFLQLPFFGAIIQIPEDVYVDGTGDCIPGAGDVQTFDYSGDGLTYVPAVPGPVPPAAPEHPFGNTWASAVNLFSYYDHIVPSANGSSLYGTMGARDYCGDPANSPGCDGNSSNTLYFEEGGSCAGAVDSTWDPQTEPLFDDLDGGGDYDAGETVYWDPAGCLTGAGTIVAIPAGWFDVAYYNGVGTGDQSCAGVAGGVDQDYAFQVGESLWADANDNRKFDSGETIISDPSGCLATVSTFGQEGYPVIPAERYTETLWLDVDIIDYKYSAGADADVYGRTGVLPILMTGDRLYFFGNTYSDFNKPVVGLDSNLPADCDGDMTVGVNGGDTCANIQQAWSPLHDLLGTENLCTDSLTDPHYIYIDANGDCIFGNGGYDRVLRNEPLQETDSFGNLDLRNITSATVSVGTTWKFYDNGFDGSYTCAGVPGPGGYTGNCDDLYFSPSGSPTSTINYLPLIYADANQDGTVDSGDTIIQDSGYYMDGPTDYPNNKLDRWDNSGNSGDRFSGLTLGLSGNATTADFANIHYCADFWLYGGDGQCEATYTAASTAPGTFCFNNAFIDDPTDPTNKIFITNIGQPTYPLFYTGCIYADIATTAARSFTFYIPQKNDVNTNGLYDAGDQGLFLYSNNDGPNDGPYSFPYTINFAGTRSSGGTSGSGDLVAPGAPTEVKLVADQTGKVTITWADPADLDLSKIVIQRDHNPSVGSIVDTPYQLINPGVQTFTEAGLKVGDTYLYKVLARDNAGNLSSSQVYSITIPAQGEVTSEPLPTPTPTPTPTPVVLPTGVQVGDLIKSANISSVYMVSSNGQRRAFPTLKVYESWYANDYSKIKIVSADTLSKIPLGPNMIIRPGTYLMKINTDPRVYTVEPNAVIRWLENETIARELYGINWAQRVIDMPDVFFVDYEKGTSLKTAVYTTGHLIQYAGETKIYYLENITKRLVSTEAFKQSLFRNEFVIKNVDALKFKYTDGPAFPVDYDFTMTMTKKNSEKSKPMIQSFFKMK